MALTTFFELPDVEGLQEVIVEEETVKDKAKPKYVINKSKPKKGDDKGDGNGDDDKKEKKKA